MNKPARIVLVFPFVLDPDKGGVQRIAWITASTLAARGHEVRMVSTTWSNQHKVPSFASFRQPEQPLQSPRDLAAFLSKTIRCPGAVVINTIALNEAISNELWNLRSAGVFARLVNCFHANPAGFRENVSHLLGNRVRLPGASALLRSRVVCAVVLRLHKWRNAAKFRRVYHRCDRFMLLSPTFFDELRWYVPEACDEHMVAIPNGFPPVESGAGNDCEKRDILLFLGRIENGQKNVLMIPALWERLAPLLPDWEFHVVGDGPDLDGLRRKVEERGLSRIVLHGWALPDAHYRRARIFTMLSSYEGFGNTLIEAQSHGVVPVAFDSYSAIRWILNDGRDALLVDAFDEAAYADAIVNLAKDERRIADMSAAARENASRFSETAMGDAWHGLVSSLMDRQVGPG